MAFQVEHGQLHYSALELAGRAILLAGICVFIATWVIGAPLTGLMLLITRGRFIKEKEWAYSHPDVQAAQQAGWEILKYAKLDR